MSNFQKTVEAKWKEYQENQKDKYYPNVMIIGTSGAGKSSLINSIFNCNVAAVGDVEPVTKGYFNLYPGEKYGKKINLIDTAGYELGQGEEEEYYKAIHTAIKEKDGNDAVHVIWYCISIANERVQEMDIDLIKKLGQEESVRKRLCVVFTKCDRDTPEGDKAKALRKAINEFLDFNISCFETSTDNKFVEHCIQNDEPCLGLENLIEWSASVIDDEDLRRCFISSQMSDLSAKRKEAKKVITIAATAAAAIGATPIPFSDAPLLVGDQTIMASKIIDIYGVSGLASISQTLIGSTLISTLGKSIVANILKCIPVVGTVVGGAVNASVASSMTIAIGTAVSEICYTNMKKALKGEPVVWDKIFDEDFANLVVQFFKKEQKK